jgi:hypothetical protein
MGPATRRFVAALLAILAAVISIVWTLAMRVKLYTYAWSELALNVPLTQARGPRPDAWDQSAHPYYWILAAALLIATAAAVALVVLVPNRGFRLRALIYCVFLAVILPATWYNYNQGDIVLPAHYQVALNVLLILLSSITAFWISQAPVSAPDIRVVKYLCLTLLLLGGVLVPALFSTVWLFYVAGLLTLAQTREISFSQITGLASVASAVVAWLAYLRDKKQSK